MTEEARNRYFDELSICLSRNGYTTQEPENGRLPVEQDGVPLCSVDKNGTVYWPSDAGEDVKLACDEVKKIAGVTSEYMKLMERAPAVKASGLEDSYKLLADFNGTILAGHAGSYGVQFVTWIWDSDRTGLLWGHYAGGNYESAKRDFATRSGLVRSCQIFTAEQLVEAYSSIHETLDNSEHMTDQRRHILEETAEQIEQCVPDLQERVYMSSQRELEHGMRMEGMSV